MRFHIFQTLLYMDSTQPVASFFDDAVHMVDAAEALGIDGFWLAEHHTTRFSLSTAPLLFLAKAADRTKRIRLGAAVLVLPLWHPVRLAEEIAALDILSGGRVELGVGKGYQPVEFGAFQRDAAQSGDAFSECLSLARRLWTEDEVTHRGAFYTLEQPVTLAVRPLQRPHPPIWVASSQPATVMETARAGLRAILGATSINPSQVGRLRADYTRCLPAAARAEARFAVTRQVYVAKEGEDLSPVVRFLRLQYRQGRHLRQSASAVAHGVPVSTPFADERPDDEFLAQYNIIIQLNYPPFN